MRLPTLLKVTAAVACVCASVGVQASIVYQLIGGTCTDSNANQVFFPDPTGQRPPTPGVSPPVCSPSISVTLRFSDAYAPGTSFNQNFATPMANRLLESFEFFDGVYRDRRNFLLPSTTDVAFGTMPDEFGVGELLIRGQQGGGNLTVRNTGIWSVSEEFNSTTAECGITSGVGPGAVCTPGRSYASIGDYSAWQRVGAPTAVPEPTALGLVAIGLFAAGLATRRSLNRA
jgi:PEP-CTERM motif